jgi:GNAT superfamily N-acetyltransferase
LVLEPGFAEPAPPHGLDIVEARDAATIAAFERALIEGTPIKALQPATPGAVWSEEVLAAEGFHAYVGLCDGRPVTCSAVMIAAGYNGIYAVATLPEFRRRGFGEAMTRRAARADPSLPAVLEASPAGRPLYERMGFEHAGELVTWEMASR